MFLKLLLMALVIAGAVLAVRLRQPTREASAAAPVAAPPPARRMPWIRVAAVAVVVLMILGTGLFLFLQWRDANEIVEVRVIDSGSGRSVTYEAYLGDVEGRSFRTVDGRVITLAEVERMELNQR